MVRDVNMELLSNAASETQRCPQHPDQLWGPPSGYWGLFSVIKQLGHDADHSPPSNAEVETVWSCTSVLLYVCYVYASFDFSGKIDRNMIQMICQS
jgi:hypothetical protein